MRPDTSGISWLSVEGMTLPCECTLSLTISGFTSRIRTVIGTGFVAAGLSTGAVAISVIAPNEKTTTINNGMMNVRIMGLWPPGLLLSVRRQKRASWFRGLNLRKRRTYRVSHKRRGVLGLGQVV